MCAIWITGSMKAVRALGLGTRMHGEMQACMVDDKRMREGRCLLQTSNAGMSKSKLGKLHGFNIALF